MTDSELADTIVALGVGKVYRAINGDAYEPPDPFRALGEDVRCYPAKQFVRDWRVAGAMMEKLGNFLIERSGTLLGVSTQYATPQPGKFWHADAGSHDESLPRAINEACVEALS